MVKEETVDTAAAARRPSKVRSLPELNVVLRCTTLPEMSSLAKCFRGLVPILRGVYVKSNRSIACQFPENPPTVRPIGS